MNTLLVIFLILAMIATVAALIRGIVLFLQASEADLKAPGGNLNGQKQNKAMQMRIMFQAVAVIIIVLLLMLKR